jgi:hypothetical protein
MAAEQGPDQDFDDEQDDDSDIPGVNGEEIQDGQFENVDQPEQAPAEKTPIDNNGHTRPYEPIVLQHKFIDLVHYFEGEIEAKKAESKSTDDLTIVTHIEQVWAGLKDATKNRHAVMKFLANVSSVKELSPAQKLAFKHWLKITKNENTGEWNHCKEAGIECIRVLEYLLKEQGQMSIPME